MKLLYAFLASVVLLGSALAQTTTSQLPTGIQTSPNLVGICTSPSTSGVCTANWQGTTSTTSTGGGYSGGNQPGYNSTTNTLMFGYTQATAAYTYAFNTALQNSGMSITGYNYSWQYINQDTTSGTLSAKVNFAGTDGTSLHSKSWTLGPTTTGWTTTSGTETFTNSLAALNIANFSLSFTGKDSRYWAGYYGPQVKNPSLSLNYTFDQCVTNPLSSPDCPGYAAAYTTQQCTANPLYSTSCPGYAAAYQTQQCTANALYDPTCPGYAAAYLTQQCNLDPLYSTTCAGYETAYFNQQCTISALYSSKCTGYAEAKAKQCTANPAYDATCGNFNTVNTSENLVPNPNAYAVYNGGFVDNSYAINTALGLSGSNVMIHGFKWGYVANANGPTPTENPLVVTNVNITEANGNSLYSISRIYSNSYNTTDYQYVFPSSKNLNTLGRFNFTATTEGTAYIGSMWSKSLYTPDPCVVDPLSSTTCSGYQKAYHDLQCTASALYAVDCPGYAAAYLTQQCTANVLYSPSCPGYEAAYKIQQCTINPLYAIDCPGYAQAYFDQQCTLDGLYDQKCPNYSTAYATKMLLEKQGMATTVAIAGSVKAADPANTTTTTVSTTGNTTVDKALPPPATTANSAAAPAAPVQLAPQQSLSQAIAQAPKEQAPPPPPPPGPGGMAMEPPQKGPDGKEAPKTARQEIQQRRQEAQRKEAANEMKTANSMEQQKKVQEVVLQAMAFTPGFSAYYTMMPDGIGYKAVSVYNNQVNVDNRRASRGLMGPSDKLHDELVNSQYKGN